MNCIIQSNKELKYILPIMCVKGKCFASCLKVWLVYLRRITYIVLNGLKGIQ